MSHELQTSGVLHSGITFKEGRGNVEDTERSARKRTHPMKILKFAESRLLKQGLILLIRVVKLLRRSPELWLTYGSSTITTPQKFMAKKKPNVRLTQPILTKPGFQ